jgi:hypothetical protein
MWLEGLGTLKKSTSLGLQSMTFWLVAVPQPTMLQHAPYICLIFFINYIIKYINIDNTDASQIDKINILGLLIVDDLAVSSFTRKDLQEVTDEVARFCKEWNTEHELNKAKVMQ